MENITAFQAITLAIAAVGAVLGFINTWRAVDQSRVKLKVVPKHAIPFGAMNDQLRFCIEVMNQGAFAVTIDDVARKIGARLPFRSCWIPAAGRVALSHGVPSRSIAKCRVQRKGTKFAVRTHALSAGTLRRERALL